MMFLDFISQNLLASYGAAVGTLALALNFMRYKHAVSNSKTKLKIEITIVKSEDEFEKKMSNFDENRPWDGGSSLSTHKVKIRNIGGVSAYIQDAWVETQNGKKNVTMRTNSQHLIYQYISEIGNVEIPPRSSRSFSISSDKNSGYLKIKRAYAIDETGKTWRS